MYARKSIYSDRDDSKRPRDDDDRYRPSSRGGADQSSLAVERDLLQRMSRLEDFQRSDHAHRMRDTRDIKGGLDHQREDHGVLKADMRRMRDDVARLDAGGVAPANGGDAQQVIQLRAMVTTLGNKVQALEASAAAKKEPKVNQAALVEQVKAVIEKHASASIETHVTELVEKLHAQHLASEPFQSMVGAQLLENMPLSLAGTLNESISLAVDREYEKRIQKVTDARIAKALETRAKNTEKRVNEMRNKAASLKDSVAALPLSAPASAGGASSAASVASVE